MCVYIPAVVLATKQYWHFMTLDNNILCNIVTTQLNVSQPWLYEHWDLSKGFILKATGASVSAPLDVNINANILFFN